MKYLLALLAPALIAAEADTGYGYAPQVYCRDTNTVVDNDYCYEQIRTVCEETTKVQPRKICTYKYNSVKETLGAQTTQVTYETKTETMKVTTCKPSGYGHQSYSGGEHQYCHEEYQTRSFKVPLVTEPLEVSVDVAAPQPEQVCVGKDIKEEKCFNVAKFEDATTTIEQTEIVLGEPNCNDVTLTLPTQACSKKHY